MLDSSIDETEVENHLRGGHFPAALWCLSCAVTKSKRPQISRENHLRIPRTATPWECTHVDTISFSTRSHGGAMGAFVFVDEATRYCLPILYKNKGDGVQVLEKFLTLTRWGPDQNRWFQSDSGREFLGGWQELCFSKGIRHIFMPPHTPELNATCEREISELKYLARFALFTKFGDFDTSDMDPKFYAWNAECILYASQLRNRQPQNALGGNTPLGLQVFHVQTSDLFQEHPPAFAEKCIVFQNKADRSAKSDQRGLITWCLGYGHSKH